MKPALSVESSAMARVFSFTESTMTVVWEPQISEEDGRSREVRGRVLLFIECAGKFIALKRSARCSLI